MATQAPNEKVATPHLDPQPTTVPAISPMPIEMQAPPPTYVGEEHGAYEKGQTQPQQPLDSNGVPLQPRTQYNTVTPLNALQSTPQPIDCPFCGIRELTTCHFTPGGTTHGMAALLCWCFCLGCIPYIGSWMKDCEHSCGNCKTVVAVWHRSGRTEVLAHAAPRPVQNPSTQNPPTQ